MPLTEPLSALLPPRARGESTCVFRGPELRIEPASQGDKAVQDLRVSSLSSEVFTLTAEKSKLEGRLAATKLELVEALVRHACSSCVG